MNTRDMLHRTRTIVTTLIIPLGFSWVGSSSSFHFLLLPHWHLPYLPHLNRIQLSKTRSSINSFTYQSSIINSTNSPITSKPRSQFLAQIKAWTFEGRRRLLYLLRTRLPTLKDDSDDTVVIWMHMTSHAIRDSSLNRFKLFFQYLMTSNFWFATISSTGSLKYKSKADFLVPACWEKNS